MLAGHCWPSMTTWLVAMGGCVVLAVALRRNALGQSVAVSLLWLALGGWLMARAVDDMTTPLPPDETTYEAVLTSEPSVHGRVVTADLLIPKGPQQHEPMKVKASILRDADGRWQSLQVGMGIRARSLLATPTNNPNAAFDYARYLQEHGFRARTFIYKDNWTLAQVDLTPLPSLERASLLAKQQRHRLLERLGSLGIQGQDYAVVAALTLGEKTHLSQQIKDDYSVSGASHVLALSGLHLGIIYSLLVYLMWRWRRKWLTQLLALTLIWSYVLLVGFSPSVMRSALMLTIYAVVSLLQRDHFSLNTLSLAAIVLLATDPLSVYDIGFQMSFLAVLGIFLFFPLINGLVCQEQLRRFGVLRWVWNMIAVSLSAQILIFPLVALHFGRFSCYFLLANFIAIPCATVLLYGIVALIPLSLFPVMAAGWVKVLAFVAKVMNGGLQLIASLPGASIENISWTSQQTACVYLLIACFYFLWKFLLRHRVLEPKSTQNS